MKKILLVFFIVFLAISYILIIDYKKKQELISIVTPLLDICNKERRCDISPVRWKKSKGGVFYKDSMRYEVDDDGKGFTITWRIATGKELKAIGGVGKKLLVEKNYD